MKPLSIIMAGLKTIFTLFGISSFCFFITAMKVKEAADDIWEQVGLTLSQAQNNINQSFIKGHFFYDGAKNAKNIALGDRVAVVNQMVAYAKTYWNSPELQTAYKNYWTQQYNRTKAKKPVPPVLTADSIRAVEMQRLEKLLKAAESGLNSPNPNVKNNATIRVENIKKQMTELNDPNNASIKTRVDNANRYRNDILEQHSKEQEFLSEYPEDPKALLKKRLQAILDITADVDYVAALTEANGIKYFVNPDYEKKPSEWKLAFRAGKAATDAVRSAAKQWLKELN
jgi:hypothetical protein